MARLAGKIAVITGGGSGIGLATARRFVAEGATVVVTGRRQDRLAEAVRQIGGAIEAFVADVASVPDLERLRDHLAATHQRVDILFANAGGGALGALGTVTEEMFDRTVGANLKGAFFTVQTLLPLMPAGGAVILAGSIAAGKGFPAFSVYAASKAAIRSLARSWTTELAPRNIRVNCIAPGTIVTPILAEQAGMSAEAIVRLRTQMAATTPIGRNGLAEEIAAAALFLASDDSSFVSGIELAVDGGQAQV